MAQANRNGNSDRVSVRNITMQLRERIKKLVGKGIHISWQSLPEVKSSGLLETLTERQVALEERKFCLITCEVVYNTELVELIGLSKQSVSCADHLPKFNRRMAVTAIERVKCCSDLFLDAFEKHWNMTPAVSLTVLNKILQDLAPHFQHYINYCTHQEDLSNVLHTAMTSRRQVVTASFSNRLNLECVVLPLQHLKLYCFLLKDIRSMLVTTANHLDTFHCNRILADITKLFGECYKLLVKLHRSQYIENIDRLLDKSVRGFERESRGNTISKHQKSVSVDPKIGCRKEATDSVCDTDCVTSEVCTQPSPSVKEQCKYFDPQIAEKNFKDVVKRGDKCNTRKRQEYVQVGRKKAVDVTSKHRSSQFIRKKCAIFEGGEPHNLRKKQNCYTNTSHSASHFTNNISNTTVTGRRIRRRRSLSKYETVNRSLGNSGSGSESEKHIDCFKNKLDISVDDNKKPSPIICSSISSSSSSSSTNSNNNQNSKHPKSTPPVITDLCHSNLSNSSRNSTDSGMESFHESGTVEKHESSNKLQSSTVQNHSNSSSSSTNSNNNQDSKRPKSTPPVITDLCHSNLSNSSRNSTDSGMESFHESGTVEKHESSNKLQSSTVQNHSNSSSSSSTNSNNNQDSKRLKSTPPVITDLCHSNLSNSSRNSTNSGIESFHESGTVEKHESSNKLQSSTVQNHSNSSSSSTNSNNNQDSKRPKSTPPVITDLCHSNLSNSSRNSTNSGIESFHESGTVEKHESCNKLQSSTVQNQTIPSSVLQNNLCQKVPEKCDAVTQLGSRLTTPTSTVSLPLKVEYKTIRTHSLGDNGDADGLQTESASCIYKVTIEMQCLPPNEEEKLSEHDYSVSNQHCNNGSPSGDRLSSVTKKISYIEELSIDTGNIKQSPDNEQQIFVSSCEPHCTSTAHLPSQQESVETDELCNGYEPMNASFRRNCHQFKPVTPSELLNKNASGADDCGNEYEEFLPSYRNDKPSGRSNSNMLSAYDFPLYQLYDFERVKHSNTKVEGSIYVEEEEHVYEEINFYTKLQSESDVQEDPVPALEISPPLRITRQLRWVDDAEVVNSGLLAEMDAEQIALQEAKYEIISSESSYYKSLLILETVFIVNKELTDTAVLRNEDHMTLFSGVIKAKQCSEKFLSVLLDGWPEDLKLNYLCHAVSKFVSSGSFQVYVDCCASHMIIEKTLQHLMLTNSEFNKALSMLQSDPVCEMFSLQSFLLLPMQRATRLPLLVQAILKRLPSDHVEHSVWTDTLVQLKKIAEECNEAVGRDEALAAEPFNSRELEPDIKKKSLTLNQLPQGRAKKPTSVWKIFGRGRHKEV